MMETIKQTIPSLYSLVNNPFVIDEIIDNYDTDATIAKPLFNMVNFAKNNIDDYEYITEIPEEYMPQ